MNKKRNGVNSKALRLCIFSSEWMVHLTQHEYHTDGSPNELLALLSKEKSFKEFSKQTMGNGKFTKGEPPQKIEVSKDRPNLA